MMLSMVNDLARHSILGICGFELKPLHNVEPAAAFRRLIKNAQGECKKFAVLPLAENGAREAGGCSVYVRRCSCHCMMATGDELHHRSMEQKLCWGSSKLTPN